MCITKITLHSMSNLFLRNLVKLRSITSSFFDRSLVSPCSNLVNCHWENPLGLWPKSLHLFNFRPTGQLKPWSEVRSLILIELLLGFELATLRFQFPALTHWTAYLFLTVPFSHDLFPQVLRLNQLKIR